MAVSALLGDRLTDVNIADAVVSAGVSDWRAITLVAIGLAESGGYEAAIRLNPDLLFPSIDVGVWQINSRWNPQFAVNSMLNRYENARAAVSIAKADTWSYSWKPWHSYTAGMHTKFMARARVAVNTVRATRGLPPI